MKLFNTLTRKKQEFKPLKKGSVSFYSCGPTVYHWAHIGNLRTYIFADVLQRALEYEGHKVKRVMNITDVGHLTGDSDAGEDKLEKEAKKEKKSVWDIAKFYEKAFLDDITELNIHKPAKIVRATDTVPDQIRIIKILFEKGYAYETEQAVYFDVSKHKDYGKLSGQSLKDKVTAARKEVVEDADKRNSADFALWFKRVGHHKDHAMHWNSPWGDGFPGWHIECSAISSKHLGQPFDIHTGGIDLIGTHHENELAQSEAAFGTPLARFWVHGEFLVLDTAKMAKSSGNFITLQTLKAKGFSPHAYRYLVLTAHYRSPLHFSYESLASAERSYDNLVDAVIRAEALSSSGRANATQRYVRQFEDFITNDLDTPKALALVIRLAEDAGVSPKKKLSLLKAFDGVLGLDIVGSARVRSASIPADIRKQAQKRNAYKIKKEYAKADEIRLILAQLGWRIDDLPNGKYVILPQKAQSNPHP